MTTIPNDHVEIERKFLVRVVPEDLASAPYDDIDQGYVAVTDEQHEVRIRKKGEEYFLTVKGSGTISRHETEIELTQPQFERLWQTTTGRRIQKTRYRITHGDHDIELDVYRDNLAGLITAEVEFASLGESEMFIPPVWFGKEVTDDPRYKNKALASNGMPSDPRRRLTIYMAGPLFTTAERRFNTELADSLGSRANAVVILPQNYASQIAGDSAFMEKMYQYCLDAVETADLVVAIVDGSDADSGTCIELGYAKAKGKRVIGVRTDLRASELSGVNLMVAKSCSDIIYCPSTTTGLPQLADALSGAVGKWAL